MANEIEEMKYGRLWINHAACRDESSCGCSMKNIAVRFTTTLIWSWSYLITLMSRSTRLRTARSQFSMKFLDWSLQCQQNIVVGENLLLSKQPIFEGIISSRGLADRVAPTGYRQLTMRTGPAGTGISWRKVSSSENEEWLSQSTHFVYAIWILWTRGKHPVLLYVVLSPWACWKTHRFRY